VVRPIPILEYHDLGDDFVDPGGFHGPYVLAKGEFVRQMTWLHSQGISTVTIGEVLRGTPIGKCVILTFDDGHISNYELALPVLKSLGLRATFFLIGEKIGTPGYLGAAQIREMLDQGMEFGSHSMTHSYMDSFTESEMSRELVTSRRVLESLLRRDALSFSVPYGFYTRRVVNCAHRAGYRVFVTEDFGYWKTTGTGIAVLPRITVRRGISLRDFVGLVERRPSAAIMGYAKWWVLASAKKLLGRKRYLGLKRRFLTLIRQKSTHV
jgi:peptidoglycan/xylan/chitin deacetylase (PgdA/CDA1 family)